MWLRVMFVHQQRWDGRLLQIPSYKKGKENSIMMFGLVNVNSLVNWVLYGRHRLSMVAVCEAWLIPAVPFVAIDIFGICVEMVHILLGSMVVVCILLIHCRLFRLILV